MAQDEELRVPGAGSGDVLRKKLKSSHPDVKAAWQETVEARKRIKELEKLLAKSQSDKQKVEEKLGSKEKEKELLAREFFERNERLKALTDENAQLRKDMADIGELRRQNDVLRKELDQSKKLNGKTKAEAQKMKETIKDLEGQIRAYAGSKQRRG
jgi:chromosome segregation ATPase